MGKLNVIQTPEKVSKKLTKVTQCRCNITSGSYVNNIQKGHGGIILLMGCSQNSGVTYKTSGWGVSSIQEPRNGHGGIIGMGCSRTSNT